MLAPITLRKIVKFMTPPILLESYRAIRRKIRARKTPPPEPTPTEGIKEIDRLGLRWRLDMSSIISREIFGKGIWEADTTKVVTDFVRTGMNCLAVGANFGYYACLMAKLAGPTGHVWAFEPTRRWRDQLRWHVDNNGFADRITILPYGLSDANRTVPIGLTPQSASMHYAPSVPQNGSENIELKPLDEVADSLGIRDVAFVSMDIDGHETAFCRGARRLLTRDRPPIAMEFAQRCLHFANSDVRELASLLHEMGYEICSEVTRLPYESEYAFLTACGNFSCDCNALAVPRSGKPKWTSANRMFLARERAE